MSRDFWRQPRGLWLKITMLQFTYWAVMAIGTYQNVYLQSEGVSATMIGRLNSFLGLITIIATPVWGIISDRIRSIRRTFLIALAIGSVLFAFYPAVFGLPFMNMPLFFIYCAVLFMFKNPYNSMMDNWTVRYCAQSGVGYGTVRWAGSLSWFIACLAIAKAVQGGTGWTFPVSAVGMILVFALALVTDDVRPIDSAPREKQSFNPLILFKNYYYTTFLVFALIIYLVVNSFMAYSTFLLAEIGLPPTMYGVLSATAAFLEIPMLLSSGWLRRRVRLVWLVMAGGVMYGIACVLFCTIAHSLPMILLSVGVAGIGNGFLIASAAQYVFDLVPDHLKATGQSVYIAVTAFSGIMSGLLAGSLIDMFTAVAFYRVLAGVSVVATALLVITLSVGKARHIPEK